MAETVPPAIEPYRLDGPQVKYLWMTTIAAADLEPTRVELSASSTVNITKLHVDHTGFPIGVETSQVPMHGGGMPQTAVGSKTVGTPTLVLKSDVAGVDGNDVISEQDLGYFVVMPGGDIEDYFARVYKVRCIVATPGEGITDFGRDQFIFTLIDANLRAVIPAVA